MSNTESTGGEVRLNDQLGPALLRLMNLAHEVEYQLLGGFPSIDRLREEWERSAKFLRDVGIDA